MISVASWFHRGGHSEISGPCDQTKRFDNLYSDDLETSCGGTPRPLDASKIEALMFGVFAVLANPAFLLAPARGWD